MLRSTTRYERSSVSTFGLSSFRIFEFSNFRRVHGFFFYSARERYVLHTRKNSLCVLSPFERRSSSIVVFVVFVVVTCLRDANALRSPQNSRLRTYSDCKIFHSINPYGMLIFVYFSLCLHCTSSCTSILVLIVHHTYLLVVITVRSTVVRFVRISYGAYDSSPILSDV